MTVFATVIAVTKDLPDIEGDKAHNIQTFATRLGVKNVSLLGEHRGWEGLGSPGLGSQNSNRFIELVVGVYVVAPMNWKGCCATSANLGVLSKVAH